MPNRDQWRALYQQLPKSVYDRLMAGLVRIAEANEVGEARFLGDDKTECALGPRVMVWEILVILIEQSGDAFLDIREGE